jgi:hypothetical protein
MVLIMVFIIILAVILRAKNTHDLPNPCEKVHQWVLRDDSKDEKKMYLICKRCNKIPGDE